MVSENDGKMGIWMTTALVIGSVVGVAVFMLPVALGPLGLNAVIAWPVSAVGAMCLGLPLARIARDGQGIQSAIADTFGSTIGFVVTWSFWISSWSGVAAIAVGGASTISRLVPGLGDPWRVALLAVALVAFAVPVNARGARASGFMAIITVLLKLLPLLAAITLVMIAVYHHDSLERLSAAPITVGSFATAVALTLFAFTGFENVTAPVGKIRNAERNIPRALVTGVGAVALLYLLSSTSIMLLLSADQIARSPAPFADAIGSRWGEIAASLVVVGVAISALGCIGCTLMAAGELCYSMSLRADLPRSLAWTNRNGTPVASQFLSALLAGLLVLSNASRSTAGLFTFILLVSTVAVLILYVVAGLATAVRDRRRSVRTMVIGGIIFAAFAFYGSGLEATLWGVGLAASAIPIRLMSRWLSGSIRPEAETPA